MGTLILVRHGESVWNKKGIWTGIVDIGLSQKGIRESKKSGEKLRDYRIDIAYTSSLKRAKETLDIIKRSLNIPNLPVIEDKAFDERDYGELTAKNKSEIKKKYGDEKFFQIRRGWNVPIRKGETLKDVYNRVVPYYKNEVLPKLKEGKNILIVAHGNSLRALIKYLDKISDKDIAGVELKTGETYTYQPEEIFREPN